MGLTHWILYSDGAGVFALNYMNEVEAIEIISDLANIKALAVD